MNTDTEDDAAAIDVREQAIVIPETKEQAAARKAAELALAGFTTADCGNCKGKGTRVPSKNPGRGAILCKTCDGTGRVWVNVNRLKGKNFLPGQSIRKLKVKAVAI